MRWGDVTRRLAIAVGVLAGILVFGTTGFMLIERWRLLDALYMTVITVATVGFNEVHPLSDAGHGFTIVLILAGVGGLGYVFATTIDFLVEGHLREIVEGRRMERTLGQLSGHHIIAGIGRVGTEVAETYAESGVPFVVIDKGTTCTQEALERGWTALSGDATEEHVLKMAGVERAASLVAALDSDEANVYVTLTARTLNPGLRIVARASGVAAQTILSKAGADTVITPTVIGARRMASSVLHPFVSDYLDLVTRGGQSGMRLEEIEVPPRSCIDGCEILRVKELETGALVLAVQHATGGVVANPPSATMVRAGDRIVVMGTVDQLDMLTRRLETLD
jgi:voltage-gated potassium channel